MRASRMAVPGAVLLAAVLVAACSSPAAPTGTPPASATAAGPGPSPAGSATPRTADWPMYHGTPDHAGFSAAMPPAGRPTLLHDLTLDGAVYASPLVVRGLTIVATENDSVYAFDADYRQVWRQRLGTPSPAGERQCGKIDPLGITGTPVYDPGTGHLLVVAELGGQVRHTLFALDPASGAIAWQKSVDLPGAAARDMQQRGALAIAHGRVWLTYGGQAGDCGDYKGRVVGVRLDGTGTPVAYTVPTGRGGGIWHPDGPVVDPAGNLLVVAGNGSAMPGAAYDHTNAVLELDAAGRMIDSFSPPDWAARNAGDVDLGSQGVALVQGRWAVLGDKAGSVWVLRPGALGGIGGQVSVLEDTCRSFGGAAVRDDVVYLPCVDGVRALRVDAAGKLHVLWHAHRASASPVIGGGRVWSLDSGGGVLHALDPATGRNTGQVRVGETNRFATPALSGDTVIVPTLTGIAVVRA